MRMSIASAEIYVVRRGEWRLDATTEDGRQVWDVGIFLPYLCDGYHTVLQSGCYAELTEPEAAETLLGFLSAAAEATPDGGNYNLFAEPVMAWARDNAGEIEYAYMMAQEPIGNAEGTTLNR